MPPKRSDPKDIDDAMEESLLEKIKEDFRSKIEEVRVEFRSQIALMKSDMIAEIVSALGSVPRHVGIEGSYEEVVEDFEVAGSSGEDKTDHVERPIGTRASQFARLDLS